MCINNYVKRKFCTSAYILETATLVLLMSWKHQRQVGLYTYISLLNISHFYWQSYNISLNISPLPTCITVNLNVTIFTMHMFCGNFHILNKHENILILYAMGVFCRSKSMKKQKTNHIVFVDQLSPNSVNQYMYKSQRSATIISWMTNSDMYLYIS